MGSSESNGETSPNSDLKGAPNRRSAVGELSSDISHLTCSATSSRLRSKGRSVSRHKRGSAGWRRGVSLSKGERKGQGRNRAWQLTVFLLPRKRLALGWNRGVALGPERQVVGRRLHSGAVTPAAGLRRVVGCHAQARQQQHSRASYPVASLGALDLRESKWRARRGRDGLGRACFFLFFLWRRGSRSV